jgi:hypothetical protein
MTGTVAADTGIAVVLAPPLIPFLAAKGVRCGFGGHGVLTDEASKPIRQCSKPSVVHLLLNATL